MPKWIWFRAQAAALLLAAPFAIRSPYRQRFLNPSPGAGKSGAADRLVEAMRQAILFNPFRYTCLERAGALHRLLRRYGIPSVLRIGVKSAASGIAAHAWVEYPPGNPLLDGEHGEFQVLQPPDGMLR